MRNPRHKIIKSKVTPGVIIFDFVLDRVVVEINTNNSQIDELIAEKAMETMGYKKWKTVMNWLRK